MSASHIEPAVNDEQRPPTQQNEHRPASTPRRLHAHSRLIIPLLVLFMVTLGCSVADWAGQGLATPTPAPTRTLAATFTPTPENVGNVIIITPPSGGTPGVIIVPPGVDPNIVIPIPATPIPPVATVTTPANVAIAPTATPVSVSPGGVATVVPVVTVLPPATALPAATETPTPTPTPTHTPTVTPTPTATVTPTPYIEVPNGLITLRTGPGLGYPLVAQLGPGIRVSIIGRYTQGDWYQICCINDQAVWAPIAAVNTFNDTTELAPVDPGPSPTPTATGTPTMTPTPTFTPTSTPYPFEQAIGPQFFPSDNKFLTIWAKLFVGPLGQEDAAEGYFLEVLFEGIERPQTNVVRPSFDHFEFSAPPGAGNRVEYNYKYEFTPPNPDNLERCQQGTRPPECTNPLLLIGEGTWTMYVMDGAGNQLSNEVTFTTRANNPHREVYIGWRRIR